MSEHSSTPSELAEIVRKHRRHVELSPGVGEDVQRYALAVCDDILADLGGVQSENRLSQLPEANQLAGLIRDASRYRWLREAKFMEIVTDNQLFRVAGGENLDKTIDAAATP